jgi:Trk-type K+ transport system membrane component
MLVPAFFMMIAGNLGFPIGLRAVLWSYNALLKPGSHHKQLTNFILEHPRRMVFYLFPPYETIALLFVIAVLTSIDWIFFYVSSWEYVSIKLTLTWQVLDIGYREQGVFAIVPAGARVINGLVQSAAVRSAGFYVVVRQAL